MGWMMTGTHLGRGRVRVRVRVGARVRVVARVRVHLVAVGCEEEAVRLDVRLVDDVEAVPSLFDPWSCSSRGRKGLFAGNLSNYAL